VQGRIRDRPQASEAAHEAAPAAGGRSPALGLRRGEAPGEGEGCGEAVRIGLAGVEEGAAAPAQHGHDVELAPAVAAVRPEGCGRRGRRRDALQHVALPCVQRGEPAHRLEATPGAGAQEAEVAYLLEAAGQDVLQEAPEELHGLQAHAAPALGAALPVGEGDVIVLAGEDAMISDGDAEDVGGQVRQRRAAVADGLGVDHPVLRPDSRVDLLEQPGRPHRVAEASPEDPGERAVGDEEVRPSGHPDRTVGAGSAAGDDVVDVGVVFEGAAPGVEHAEEAGERGADPPRVGGEVLDGAAGGVEEGAVAEAMMSADEAPQLGGEGEGEEEVGSGQEALLLDPEPVPALVVLAGGAVAIAAALGGAVVVAAGGAGEDDGAELSGTAGGDGAEDRAVLAGNGVAEAREVGGAVAAYDLGEGGHERAPATASGAPVWRRRAPGRGR
jgi:hypothetical protein